MVAVMVAAMLTAMVTATERAVVMVMVTGVVMTMVTAMAVCRAKGVCRYAESPTRNGRSWTAPSRFSSGLPFLLASLLPDLFRLPLVLSTPLPV